MYSIIKQWQSMNRKNLFRVMWALPIQTLLVSYLYLLSPAFFYRIYTWMLTELACNLDFSAFVKNWFYKVAGGLSWHEICAPEGFGRKPGHFLSIQRQNILMKSLWMSFIKPWKTAGALVKTKHIAKYFKCPRVQRNLPLISLQYPEQVVGIVQI